MANPFGAKTASSSPFGGTGAAAAPHTAHGVGGFFENFGSDVKGAVTGFIPGTVHLVEHPVASVKQMAGATWQTWSPLFHGHPLAFAQDFYQHPLAPLLDVASILDIGLGAAGTVGLKTGAEEGSLLGRAAALRTPLREQLEDPTGAGRIAFKNYSTRPLRRLTQTKIAPAVTSRLPEAAQGGLARASFEKAFASDMARRVIAKSTIVNAMLQVGRKLDSSEEGTASRRALVESTHSNLFDHGFKMPPDEATAQLMRNSHYRPVADASQIKFRDHVARIQGLRNKVAKSYTKALQHSAAGHSVAGLERELEHQNGLLKEMHEKGYRIAMPAKSKLKEPTERQLMERNAAPLVEVQQNIKRLEKQLVKARKSKVIMDKAHEDINTLSSQLTDLQSSTRNNVYDHFAATPENFEHYAQNLGRYGVVGMGGAKDGHFSEAQARAAISKAMVDKNGMVSLVPKHDAANLGQELDNSSKLLRMMWRKPTRVWKMLMVGYTPRTVVNNTVGNLLIYLSREDPISGLWGLWNGYRLAHGVDKAGTDFFDTATKSGILRKYFTADTHNSFGQDLLDEAATAKTRIGKKLGAGMYPLVHKIADLPVRIGAIFSYLRRDPLVKKYMKAGDDFTTAARKALEEDPGLKMRASEHARSISGDYLTLTKGEQKVKDLVPFYLWDRHIVRSTKNLVADTPTRAVVGQQISQQGEKEVQKYFGTVPSYLAGVLPLSMLGIGGKGDRQNIVTTTSLNPFNTIGDLAGVAQSLTAGHTPNPGSDLFDQVNPILTGAIEYASGTSLLSGAPLKRHGGAIPSILVNTAQGIPEVRIAQGLTTPATGLTAKGNTKLYKTGSTPAITSFLGVPIKAASRTAAAASATEEATGKKPSTSKKKKNPFLG